MAEPFSADQTIVEKGKATSYFEDILYGLGHVEEGSPASSDPGEPGEMRRDSTYLYVCYATDSWGRVALTTGY